jgi:FixJ family two-component response regulator
MPRESTVWVVDDDPDVREGLGRLLEMNELNVESCESGDDLLGRLAPDRPGCVVLDVRMPGLSGLEVQREMTRRRLPQPIIFLTGHADVSMAVGALRANAFHFLEKPVKERELLAAVRGGLAEDARGRRARRRNERARARVESLSPREEQVARHVAEGLTSRQIAEHLGLSVRTVEMHRARLLRRLGAHTSAEAVQILQAGSDRPAE